MPRDDKLVPIAELASRATAEEAWARLEEAGIPANILTDPGPFGGPEVTRLEVARAHAADAQRLIADLVLGEREA
ncbi:MAG: hypothetical protein PVI35_05640 [Acidimicrobiia bacterium]